MGAHTVRKLQIASPCRQVIRSDSASGDPPRVCSSIIYQPPAYIPATLHCTQVPLGPADPSPQSPRWADGFTCVYEPVDLLATPSTNAIGTRRELDGC